MSAAGANRRSVRRTGNVEQRGSSWSIRYREPGGDQVRESGFATRKQAEAALAERTVELGRGVYTRPERITLESFATDWLAGLEPRGMRPTTIHSYTDIVTRLVLPVLGKRQLQTITAHDLDRLFVALRTSGRHDGTGGLSPRTVRYVAMIVRRILADADRKGLVARNVADLATQVPSTTAAAAQEQKIWSPEQLRQFLTATAGTPDGIAFRVAALTGLRRGELLGLRWADVDFAKVEIRVAQQVATAGGRSFVGPVKTHRSRRAIGLDSGTLDALRRHRIDQAQHRLVLGPAWIDHDLVFPALDGTLQHPDALTRRFARLTAEVGLPHIRLHDLRHGHVTHLLAAGVNARVVADRAGHASVAFTLQVYGHALPGDQHRAAEAVAALIDGPVRT